MHICIHIALARGGGGGQIDEEHNLDPTYLLLIIYEFSCFMNIFIVTFASEYINAICFHVFSSKFMFVLS